MRSWQARRFTERTEVPRHPRPAASTATKPDMDWATLVNWCRRNRQAGRVSVDRSLILEVADKLAQLEAMQGS